MHREIAVLSLVFALWYSYESSCPTNSVKQGSECVPFGHATRQKVFMMESGVQLNHGSFGATPRAVFDHQVDLLKEMEANTFLWFIPTMGYRSQLLRVKRELASFVGGVDPADIVLIENASSAINSVLRSILSTFPAGAKVLRLNFAYMMVKNTLSYLAEKEGLEIVEQVIDLPTNADDILRKVEMILREHNGTIKLAILDHIASTPAIILPIKELVNLTRSYGALSLVDGAHALGQVKIDLPDIDPDFYTSNGHKWLCTAKSAAFLYVHKNQQKQIYPNVISSLSGADTDFQTRFEYTGTRDYTAYLSFLSALEFRNNIGDDVVMSYNKDLCLSAAKMMSDAWNTTRPVPDEMTASTINVRLPCNTRDQKCYTWDDTAFYIWLFIKDIWALTFVDAHGVRYLRLSCQIYNEMADYEALKQAMDEFATLTLLLSPLSPVVTYVSSWFSNSTVYQSETALFSPYPGLLTPLKSLVLYLLSYFLYFSGLVIKFF
jgi:selenocysteine lyase/cysteine desulfurase